LLRHKWSSSRPSGIGPTKAMYDALWAVVVRLGFDSVIFPYPLCPPAPTQIQHPVAWSILLCRFILACNASIILFSVLRFQLSVTANLSRFRASSEFDCARPRLLWFRQQLYLCPGSITFLAPSHFLFRCFGYPDERKLLALLGRLMLERLHSRHSSNLLKVTRPLLPQAAPISGSGHSRSTGRTAPRSPYI
jgi:hypothetical protein